MINDSKIMAARMNKNLQNINNSQLQINSVLDKMGFDNAQQNTLLMEIQESINQVKDGVVSMYSMMQMFNDEKVLLRNEV
jgi:hypothetical protein